jgi:hypothetical protein
MHQILKLRRQKLYNETLFLLHLHNPHKFATRTTTSIIYPHKACHLLWTFVAFCVTTLSGTYGNIAVETKAAATTADPLGDSIGVFRRHQMGL